MGWKLADADWRSASTIDRSFVRVRNDEPTTASYWHIPLRNSATHIVSVIIPFGDSARHNLLQRLLDQLAVQSLREFETFIVKGDKRQGRAINAAAAIAKGKYLLTLDDDTSLAEPRAIELLVAAMEQHPDIAAAGGNNTIPGDASPFVKKAMRQIPRRSWEPVKEITDSDLAQHGCLLMRAELFKAVGGENELMPRGLDPYLREEFRKLGKRVVLVPGVIYYHLTAPDLRTLLCQSYSNGKQAAFANRTCPQWIFETPSKHGAFKARLPLPLRLLRYPLRMLSTIFSGQWIWLLSQAWYAAGFARECLFPKRPVR